ncbi:hypothetical protein GCM10008024_00810 [Allgaiera indica]|uniref:Endonuclease/Exonuclease/phosphatase family protein n=1 Tax=Allgaiera indica TaxID=765699 RepID=A0AAN4UMV8_9RHOB|nr:endonuclease/exonuclease/phosphatase family protein [Allgaiera indica]GHD98210.1 hypothetical protein GCM10008024_00810 [Allgaiera indica]SDW51621.1 Endonuclease/Exonuclease/phosphatase family protein [Allgaiera indica]
MLQDIVRGKDPAIAGAIRVIARTDPDVLLLTGIDYDRNLAALAALQSRLAKAGAGYAFRFAFPPNTGVPSGCNLDGDGRRNGPRDAQGYGRFPGQGGMALLSRLPIDIGASRDFSSLPWRDLPGAEIGHLPAGACARTALRLSTTGHWDIALTTAAGPLHLFAYSATPPVFDGPEDRNGRRNHDETAFWLRYLDGLLAVPPPKGPFVILGNANLDPADGEGRRDAIRALLTDPRLQDPLPASTGAAKAGDQGQIGNPALDTADWPETGGPGNLRVDYVLPSAKLAVAGAGVFWPVARAAGADAAARAGPHHLVWVDVRLTAPPPPAPQDRAGKSP